MSPARALPEPPQEVLAVALRLVPRAAALGGKPVIGLDHDGYHVAVLRNGELICTVCGDAMTWAVSGADVLRGQRADRAIVQAHLYCHLCAQRPDVRATFGQRGAS